ncbi:MAG: ABC transporter ATP-binding protein [Bacilli bacterium]
MVYKRLGALTARFKKTFFSAVLLLIIAVGLDLIGPFLVKQIIDDHITGVATTYVETTKQSKNSVEMFDRNWIRTDRIDNEPTTSRNATLVSEGSKWNLKGYGYLSEKEISQLYKNEQPGILQLILLYVGIVAIAAVLNFAKRYMLARYANEMVFALRTDAFSKLQRLPMKYFDERPAGTIVSRVTNDTEAVKELFVNVFSNFLTGFVMIFGILVAVFILDFQLGLFTLCIVPIVAIWSVLYRKYASKINRTIRSYVADLNAMMNESISNMRIIQAFVREDWMEKRFEKTNALNYKAQSKLLNVNALTSHNLINLLRNGSYALIIWYFGGEYLSNVESVISIGLLYAYIDYLSRLFQPLSTIVSQFAVWDSSMVSAERMFELFDEEEEPQNLPYVAEEFDGNIAFNNVGFSYNGVDKVLKDVSFSVKSGQTVAFVGHTGSGKSTIINALMRFYEHNEGDISIDGRNIESMSKQSLRSGIGLVLQDPVMFEGSIRDNITLQTKGHSDASLVHILEQMGAKSFLERLDQGLDTPVLERGSSLSAGEKQLINFARALLFNQRIIILDEATANVDSETEQWINKALELLSENRTIIIIAHRLSTIAHADQIIVLQRGEIIEKGTHSTLLEQNGVYAEMVAGSEQNFAS